MKYAINVFAQINKKDSSTFDLTVQPLSGTVTAGPLLNSDRCLRQGKNIMKFRKKHSF
jgi:hypothetical protein